MSNYSEMCNVCTEIRTECNCISNDEVYGEQWKEDKILSLETGGVTRW